MYYLPVAFGVWLHTFFWGCGFALLAMPPRWKGLWPVLAWPAGFALQSVVVWVGAYANLAGTDAYAWWAEIVPLVLLVFGMRNRRTTLWVDLTKFSGLLVLMAGNVVAIVLPLAFATRGLTTLSLGSFDAADYAAGARVLKEFAHSDRTGFLGLTEVVRIASVDNFFDFWLRLNHFTPSALIAFNGTIFNCSPAELTSILTAVLLVSSLPVVFLGARVVLRYNATVALWVTALYGLGPVTWYAVFHVAIGQLLAAQAIGLATWAGIELWRSRSSRLSLGNFSGVLLIAYALILGSYNFILLVCLAPAVAYAGGLALRQREWSRFVRWLAAMLWPLVLVGLVLWERVAGLAERFLLFQTYDFGWRIPLLTPEGWHGFVADHELNPFPLGWRVLAIVLFLGATLTAWIQAFRRKRFETYMIVCLTLPVLAGYAYLTMRGKMLGTNASYDAYKILAVFYPVLLPAVTFWAGWGVRQRGAVRGLTFVAMAGVLAGNIRSAWYFAERVQIAPLTVSRELVQLQKIEKQSDVRSLNMLVMDGWSRLWANELLLRKPQYFQTHTYEGRLNTPLRGEWDLVGGFVRIALPDGGSRPLSAHYVLVDARSRYLVRVNWGEGWFEPEQSPDSTARWIWTKGTSGSLRLNNPQGRELQARLSLRVRAVGKRALEIWVNGHRESSALVGEQEQLVVAPAITLSPGDSTVEFRSTEPVMAAPGDSRALGFCIYAITVEVIPEPDVSAK